MKRHPLVTYRSTAMLAIVAVLCSIIQLAPFARVGHARSFGAVVVGFNQAILPANDDGSTDLVPLGFTDGPIVFFGQTYNHLYVNNNGNVTFDNRLSTYTPFSLLSTTHPMIAPFFADVDTRGQGSGLTSYGLGTFAGRPAFGVTWADVGGVGYYPTATDKLNRFQMLIVKRSDVGPGDFDIVFNYDQIQWETGGASGGEAGLGGDSARAGFSNGLDTSFELPGSAVNGAFLDGGPNALASHTNVGVPGRYVYPVRNGISRVYNRSQTLVNGTGLPDCPQSGPIIEPCTTVADGFTLGHGAFSTFSDLHIYSSANWSGSNNGSQLTFTNTLSSGDQLTIYSPNYSGPANVQFAYHIDGDVSATSAGCSSARSVEAFDDPSSSRRLSGPSAAAMDGFCGGISSAIGHVVNGITTSQSLGSQFQALGAAIGPIVGSGLVNGASASDALGSHSINVITQSAPQSTNFAPSDLTGIQQAQVQMQQTIEMITTVNQQASQTAGSIIQNLGDTVSVVSVLVTDPAGNPIPNLTVTSTSGAQYPLHPLNQAVIVDTTPPVIIPDVTGTLGQNGWYTSDVAIQWSVTDVESGLSSQSGCGNATVTADTAGTTFTCTATSTGGTSSQAVTVKRDATLPTLMPAPSSSTILLNGSGTVAAGGSDATSGIATQNCGTLNTASVGSKSVTCTATDRAGNQRSVQVPYAVTYGVKLLYDATQAKNSGSTYPIKVSLIDANGVVKNSASLILQAIGPAPSPGNSQPNEQFKLTDGVYQYNLKTTGFAAGSYNLNFSVAGDPVTHSAPFKVR